MILGRKLFPHMRFLPPELAHRLALWGLSWGLAGRGYYVAPPSLQQKIWGMDFSSPLCLAAGFDKNAKVAKPLLRLGFAAVEVGTVTPLSQAGNQGPRLFRLEEDGALINSMGFNSDGMEAVKNRLKEKRPEGTIIGVNIGKNRASQDALADFEKLAQELMPHADYIVINVSSPNTPGLRSLQKKDVLEQIIEKTDRIRKKQSRKPPILVKLSPDILPHQAEELANLLLSSPADGAIIANTTVSRPLELKNANRNRKGGLSGRPLMEISTHLLEEFYKMTRGRLPLIASGGVFDARDVYRKIRAGASLVQIYTAMIFEGPLIVDTLRRDLATLLLRERIKNISEVVGADVKISK